jgi:hypothetical protein
VVGFVHDKVIEVLTGVALTEVTGPGAANDLPGAGRSFVVGAGSSGDTVAVSSGATVADGTGASVADGTGASVADGTGDSVADGTGDTVADDDAEAMSAWKTTEVKIPARPIIHTVRTTIKRFIKTRFRSCSNPHGAACRS